MNRKEGIIKRYKKDVTTNLTSSAETKLTKTEYNNYVELCYYCYEEPLGFDEWLNQTIKPAKN